MASLDQPGSCITAARTMLSGLAVLLPTYLGIPLPPRVCSYAGRLQPHTRMSGGAEEVSPPHLQTHTRTNYPDARSVISRALDNDPAEWELQKARIR